MGSERGEDSNGLTTLPAIDPFDPFDATEPPTMPTDAAKWDTTVAGPVLGPLRPPQLPPESPPTSGMPWWWTRGSSSQVDPTRWSARRLAVVAASVFVAALVAGAIAGPFRPHRTISRAPRRGSLGAPFVAPPRLASPNDPAVLALADLVVGGGDVGPDASVEPLPGGDDPVNQPTLDLCNGKFASEPLRRARLQVVVADQFGATGLSTEAVLYEDSASAAQAMAEVRDTAASCPPTPVSSPVGEPTVITTFSAPPDGSWTTTDGVERAAFDLTTTDAAGATHHSIAVYLRRGRFLEGVYFPQPDAPQAAIAGQTDIGAIVAVFEHRLQQLPAALVNGLTA